MNERCAGAGADADAGAGAGAGADADADAGAGAGAGHGGHRGLRAGRKEALRRRALLCLPGASIVLARIRRALSVFSLGTK